MSRCTRLLALALVLLGAGPLAAAPRMEAALLAPDVPAAAVPLDGPPALQQASGAEVQLLLPYRAQGSWVRLVPTSLPREPRLVVGGMAAGTITLVLPDGRRLERSKVRPADDAAASLIAAVFVLPDTLHADEPLMLHFSEQHRTLVDLRLLEAADWRVRERTALGWAYAVYGALGAFAFIALAYWALLRDRLFADHAAYLACLVAFLAASTGMLYGLFSGGLWSSAGLQGQSGLATAAIAFSLGFCNRFLDTVRYLPRIARAWELARVALLVAAAVVGFSPIPTPFWGVLLTLLLVALNAGLIATGVAVAMKGNRYARYFLAGWIPLTLCTSLRALQATGLVEIRYELAQLYAIGAIWEALVLTIGIADRALGFRRERDAARHLADHDPLTGVLSRRASESRLADLVGRARSGEGELALLFVDIDRFKSINDRYGHAAGDAVLSAVARRFSAQLRSDDVLGRWGGEEFVALLPGAGEGVARQSGERIRRVVEREPVMIDGIAIPVTVSIGIAVFDPAREDSRALLARADAALYRAKSNGRNRVEELVPA